MKIEFDASLISSTIELTHLQVLGCRVLRFGDSPLCLRSRYKMRNYGLKASLCMRIAFLYTTREPETNST